MRSLSQLLVFTLVVVTLVVVVLVPALVKPMVESAVRDASPFGEQPLTVDADVSAIDLLRGVVGEIRISGEHLTRGETTVASLDLDVRDVGIGDHAFASVAGGLRGVGILLADGTPLTIESVDLSGPSSEVSALAHLDRAATLAFITWVFADAGIAPEGLGLEDGGISVTLFEQQVTLAIGAQDGALVIPDVLGAGPFELVVPQPDDAWRITGASINGVGLDIQASVDVTRLLDGAPETAAR